VVSVKRLVCIDEELFERVKRLLEELRPALVVETAESAPSGPAASTTTLREMILSVMRPGEKYAADKVARLIRERYGVEVDRKSVAKLMCQMRSKGLLVRVDNGVYALPQREKRERAVYERPATEMVLSVLEPGRVYSRSEILRLVEERYGVQLPQGTLDSALATLVMTGKLRRVERGAYQLAG
jgi:predicted transcriptional regulator of viral defense system